MQGNQLQRVRTVSKFTLFVVAFTGISLWASLLFRHDFGAGEDHWNTFRGFPFTWLKGSLYFSDVPPGTTDYYDYIQWHVRWSRFFLVAVFWTIVGCLVAMATQQVVRREFTRKLALVLAVLLFLLSSATLWWFWPDLVHPYPQLDEPTFEGQSLLPTHILLTSIIENNATTYLKTPVGDDSY